MVQSVNLCTLTLKNLTSTIWDSFHGSASPSYDIFFSVTDGQNANTELITLSYKQLIRCIICMYNMQV